jgi:hypothetical protein
MNKRNLLLFLLATSSLFCHAQIAFEKGYFIGIDGKKTECLIKNYDWLNTPTDLRYKLNAADAEMKVDVKDIQEFGVDNLKFIRATVKLDTSSSDPKKLSLNRNPDWVERSLLLKIQVEGKATMYRYHTNSLDRFFYSLDSSPIEQLIYKQYFNMKLAASTAGAPNQISSNKGYLGQLKTMMCKETTDARLMKIRYEVSALEKYFVAYNACSGSPFVNRKVNYNSKMSFRITPGYNFSTYTLEDALNNVGKYKNAGFRIGAELEFALPFNRNKWAVFIEPTYQQFSKDANFKITYKSIEVSLALRHNFFLSANSKIFINVGMVPDFIVQSTVDVSPNHFKAEGFAFGLMGGIGLSVGKFSLEARQYSNRNHQLTPPVYNSSYQELAVILGYKVF